MKSGHDFVVGRGLRGVVSRAGLALAHLLYRRTVLVLTVLTLLGVAGLLWHVNRLQQNLVETLALRGTWLVAEALGAFRTIYTSEVVEVVRKHGIEVTHDYKGKERAIPLPATMTIELGRRLGQSGTGIQSQLYSDFPFPWRSEGGLRDEFQREAMRRLRQDPSQPFYRFEEFQGRLSLRYATADLMRPSCVDCHNSHPASPKTDWKAGDVRGVLEVVRSMDVVVAQTRENLRQTFYLVSGMAFLWLSALGVAVGKLRHTSVELEQRVTQRTAQLESANGDLQREVEQRIRAEQNIGRLNQDLEAQARQLEAANKELEAFTYSVSHDLRAPLRYMDGFAQLLVEESGPGLRPNVQHYLDRVREGTRKMELLIDELLNLSRVGRQELRWHRIGLNSLVEEVLADLQPETAGREIDWQIGRLPSVECDPVLIKQVFANLLSNALKFTRTRPRAVIRVDQTTQSGQPVVFVRDNGVGFNMQYAERLFGVFQRLHRQEDFEGTGVGLATVQRIIHKHGGRVWAQGELDQGATFYFSLGTPEKEPAEDHPAEGAPHDGHGK